MDKKTSETLLHNGKSYSGMLYELFRKVYMRNRSLPINDLINLKYEFFKSESYNKFQ